MPNAPIPAAPAPVPGAPLTIDAAHYPISALRWAGDDGWMPKSRVMLSRIPAAGTVVVFVHGWSGSGVGTWDHFPRALRFTPEARTVDFLFVDYPSVSHTVAFCSAQLRGFLLDLVRDPTERILNSSLPRGAPRRPPALQYGRIIIVAHSMGAFISRRALLDLDRNDLTRAERERFQLLFFAPAHKGSRLPLLIESGLGLDWLPGAVAVGKLLTLRYRSLEDLAVGSGSLTSLAEDGREMTAKREAAHEPTEYLRARVIHAENDKVVVQDTFYPDYPASPIMRQNHRTVCKPGDDYLKPVEALRRML
jgi:pimeloyl-ACP methyl ester carboxylesterase